MRPIIVAALWLMLPQVGYAQTYDVLELTESVEAGRSLWSTTYDQTDQNSPKIFVVVDGATHYGITDVNHPDGAKADEAEPGVDQTVSISAIAVWALRFIWPVYLFGDLEDFWLCGAGNCHDDRVTVQTSL